MSANIKIPIELLKEKADLLTQYAETNADVFDRLYNHLELLGENREWNGKSHAAALEVTRSNKKKHENLVSDLNNLAKFLKQFSEEISQKDASIKSQIDGI